MSRSSPSARTSEPRQTPASPPNPVKAWAEHEAIQAEQQLRSSHPGFGAGSRARPRNPAEAVEDVGLPALPRLLFSQRLGHDFSRVRVHKDAEGAELAEQAGARAVTFGEDIFFAEGEYDPASEEGRELLAHELAHVAQQEQMDGEAFAQTKPKGQTAEAGVGRAPPEEPFAEAEGKAPEDDFVLFNKDSADLDLVDPRKIDAFLKKYEGAVDVELHGYASLEGDEPYNRNLSAHRAVAIKRMLADMLPPGSKIRLFAHGETFAFGKDLKENRRVGIKIASRPAELATPDWSLDPSRLGRRPSFGLPPLQLDLPPLPSTPPLPLVVPEVVESYPTPWLLPPDPRLSPLAGFYPDYFSLMGGAWAHLQTPSLRDFSSVLGHAESNYLFFYSILGPRGRLPLLGDASDLANLTASYAYSNQMGIEHPTSLERENREFEIEAKKADPNFWQTPIITKTWEWDFPWYDFPEYEKRKKEREKK